MHDDANSNGGGQAEDDPPPPARLAPDANGSAPPSPTDGKRAKDPTPPISPDSKPANGEAAAAPANKDDGVQREFDDALNPLLNMASRESDEYRAVTRFLLDSGRPHDECYSRMRQAGLKRAKASRFACVARCPAVAEEFIARKLVWEVALRRARKAHPTAWTKTAQQLGALALGRFVRLLIAAGLKEFVHPEGIFRLMEIHAPLSPDSNKNEKEQNDSY